MANLNDTEWEQAFLKAIEPIHGKCTYQESAVMLSTLVKTGLLKFTDLENNPQRFFKAHRLLLTPSKLSEASGFGVRFTVEFNLFAGSILGLGSPEQIALLDGFQERGVLGCFNLTEVYAGVNSGLIVQTTATWNEEKQQFLIESPDEGAKKNWISQGLTATHSVVMANLIIDGKKMGPHGFLVEMRDEQTKELKDGVFIEDMGQKTVANDLDNARVSFKNFWVDKSALLSRFAEIRNNKYIQTTKERMRIEILGQRLLTGRLAIAQASVLYSKKLFSLTKEYASKKMCWAPKGQSQPSLSEIPHVAAIFAEGEAQLDVLERYNASVEKKLNKVLREKTIPDQTLVELIAVSKIKSVQTGITLTDKLGREVGSYALMASGGFGSTHWLYMCQFAEGDTRILMQKLARDSMKSFQKSSWTATGKEMVFGTSAEQQEMKCRFQLTRALSAGATPVEAGRLWNENFQLVYQLAEAVCAKYIALETDDDATQVLFNSKL